MAMHPERFEKDVLVEYRGAMGRGNRSPFWEEVGKVFTGLPYGKADRLSVTNKEFIWSLLPKEPIYCALLPKPVQAAIGAIHPDARQAARLLESIGFRPLPQIEPFDGGPYYLARRANVSVVRSMRRIPAGRFDSSGGGRFLVGTDAGGKFRAVMASGATELWKRLRVDAQEVVNACRISR
jgi:arginine N-succinyltransferase